MQVRFLEEKDEQSGRRDAEENDGVDEAVHLGAIGKIGSLAAAAAITAAARPLGIKLATIVRSAALLISQGAGTAPSRNGREEAARR